jgi:Tfp pilus tip-associated adhesin PilY1
VNYGYASATMNNIAKAGGTKQAFFAVQEAELHEALSKAIYDAVKGSYATSPIAAGAPQEDATALGTVVLDSRADFPSWKGHLIAYDASTVPPTLLWDTDAGFDPVAKPNFWKQRNVFTSSGATMVKVGVDPATGNITNAADLRVLGLGATDAEAALVARWMLGDPAMKNPATMGAMINSTPTQVGRPPEPSLTYVGASDGMLHAFHSRTQIIGGVTYPAGGEAFAYIPQDMLPVITRLYAQGGQAADPRRHLFGLANSPKLKRFCTANCTAAASAAVWKTVLVMPEGFGGNDVFALDISAPFGDAGIKSTAADPPVRLLWNTQTSAGANQATYDQALGRTISLPGFYFAKTSARDNYRAIFASGYTDVAASTVGLRIVNASAHTGGDVTSLSVGGMGLGCGKPRLDPTEPTLLADVAIARRFGAMDYERIAAAYFGDTWGNLFRYVPPTDSEGNLLAGTGTVTPTDSFTCSHPLHFAPTVVQLDRHDNSKNPGHIYLAQVTNSSMDLATDVWSTGFPASQLILRRDLAEAGSAVKPDLSWGDASGRIVLDSSNPAQICAVWNVSGKTCTTPMPSNARPVSSPTGILRADFDGFALVTLWYLPDPSGCTKGKTYLTIHEVDVSENVSQVHGEKVADEPVVGAVFAAGKLVVVLSTGPKPITPSALGKFKVEGNRPTSSSNMVDRYRRMGWTELP